MLLVLAMAANIRQHVLQLLSKAYSQLSAAKAAALLGLSEQESLAGGDLTCDYHLGLSI